MHIDDVIKNLENTIQGKELLLKSIRARPVRNADAELVVDVSSHYIGINLHELNNILADCRKVKSFLTESSA